MTILWKSNVPSDWFHLIELKQKSPGTSGPGLFDKQRSDINSSG
jgi:hypothetical protein